MIIVLSYFIDHQVKLFMKNTELNLEKINKKTPLLTVALGDFKTENETWGKNGKALKEESKHDILTCSYGQHQLNDEPIHLFDSSSSSSSSSSAGIC